MGSIDLSCLDPPSLHTTPPFTSPTTDILSTARFDLPSVNGIQEVSGFENRKSYIHSRPSFVYLSIHWFLCVAIRVLFYPLSLSVFHGETLISDFLVVVRIVKVFDISISVSLLVLFCFASDFKVYFFPLCFVLCIIPDRLL